MRTHQADRSALRLSSGSVGLLQEVEVRGAVFARHCGVIEYRYTEVSFLQHHRVVKEIVFHRIVGLP